MNCANFCISPLHTGGLLDPTDALMAYLVRRGIRNGMPSQDDLSEIFLTLHEIALRPLPVLLDPGLIDGEIGAGGLTIAIAGDDTGNCGENTDCEERLGTHVGCF